MGEPAYSISRHTADAATILEYLCAASAVLVGTSAGAAIAIDLAVRRPDLAGVVAHEFPWRFIVTFLPSRQVGAVAKIGSLALRGRQSNAAETLLRSAYAYRDGGSAWDAFPEDWRQAGRENARAALADFRNSITDCPSRTDLATVEAPVVCSYGARSPDSMLRLVRSLASAIPTARTHQIEGAGHEPLRCNSQLRSAHRRHDHSLTVDSTTRSRSPPSRLHAYNGLSPATRFAEPDNRR